VSSKVTDKKTEKAIAAPKKPYQKPSFQFEKVFETMALSCGKMNINLSTCKFNRKAS
jgi:hypothetical protein